MKVALITLHAIKNYGSVLQTFATQSVLHKMGAEVEVINYIRNDALDKNIIKTWTKNDTGTAKLIKRTVLLPTVHRWQRIFNSYLRTYINLSKQTYLTEKDFADFPVEADIYCTGSDQVWNSGWNNGIERPLYLTFASDEKKKIALAASFGKRSLSDEEIKEVAPLLRRYDYISVRETSAVEILSEIGIKNRAFCLDPTLLLAKEEWQKHMSEKKYKKPYVLIYQLNRNPELDRYALEFAKRRGLRLLRLCTRYDQVRLSGSKVLIPKVQEFISLINNAEFVITDSFHATAFSINLNKEFLSIYPDEYSCRISDILNLFDLQDRHLCTYDNYTIADKRIDYTAVNKKLNDYRDESLEVIAKFVGIDKTEVQ